MVKSAIRARIEDTGTGGSATAAASKQSVAMSEAVMQRIDALQAQLAAGGALKSSQAATIPDRLIHGGRVSVSSFQSSGKLHPEDHKRALRGEYVSFYDAAKRSAGSTTALSGGRRDIVGSIDADNVVSLNAKATTSATDKCVDDPVFWTMHYAWIDARIQSRPELESEYRSYTEVLSRLAMGYRESAPTAFQRYDTSFRRTAAAIEASTTRDGAPAIADWARPDEVLIREVIGTASFTAIDTVVTRKRKLDIAGGGQVADKESKDRKGLGADKKKKATCRGFNLDGCSYGPKCRFAHICDKCQSKDHGAQDCP